MIIDTRVHATTCFFAFASRAISPVGPMPLLMCFMAKSSVILPTFTDTIGRKIPIDFNGFFECCSICKTSKG
jgi:hypothetical protein